MEEVTTGTKIPISKIKPHPLNPRVDFTKLPPQDKNAPENDDPVTNRLMALSESIRKSGGHPFNPILVRPCSGGYEIICGHTRFKAMTEVLGYGELEVGKDLVVREMDDEAVVRVMIDDNLKRWRYNPAEFAEALKLLVNTCGLSIREVARQYNVDHKWLLRILKVSELPDRVKAKVVWGKAKTTRSALKPGVSRPRPTRSKGIITVHHAEELAKLETNRQKEAVGLAIEKHSLTVKETAHVVDILEKNPWEPVDDIVHLVRAASSVTSGIVSTLDVEFNDSRIADALDAAARAAKVTPSVFAAQKIVEELVNDGYLKRDILRQNEYRDWYEKEVLSAQA
ncbi:MAG: ParB/RepB/Spo0J family partition protein, partial [Nitrososphaerales archaeon]|nr:ParB/RepB/Spo0J family partition protein [Nitrososphaerales archaeon]